MDRPSIGCGVVIFNERGQFLMGKRKSAHANGRYCLPGGWIEFGETINKAVQREAWEETGLKIHKLKLIGITENIFKEENKHSISVIIGACIQSGIPQVMEPDKCESWIWVNDWDHMPNPTFTDYKRFISAEKIKEYKTKYIFKNQKIK